MVQYDNNDSFTNRILTVEHLQDVRWSDLKKKKKDYIYI